WESNSLDFNTIDDYQKWVGHHLSLGHRINSVQNSSGETLTVGDETNYGKIIEIKIGNDGLLKINCDAPYFIINPDAVHPAKPVLKTEDGYILQNGDFIHVVEEDFSIESMEYGVDFKVYEHPVKIFRFRENAEKYIYDNKPQFSRKQILDLKQDCYNLSSTAKHDHLITKQFDKLLGL
ncbi:MAG: hypothetical protein V4664_04230, partial [Patescibacteria group bacterium]